LGGFPTTYPFVTLPHNTPTLNLPLTIARKKFLLRNIALDRHWILTIHATKADLEPAPAQASGASREAPTAAPPTPPS